MHVTKSASILTRVGRDASSADSHGGSRLDTMAGWLPSQTGWEAAQAAQEARRRRRRRDKRVVVAVLRENVLRDIRSVHRPDAHRRR